MNHWHKLMNCLFLSQIDAIQDMGHILTRTFDAGCTNVKMTLIDSLINNMFDSIFIATPVG